MPGQALRLPVRYQGFMKQMKFDAWIAEIQDTVTFVVEPEEWRKYYDAELSPLDAIAQHRTDEEV